jgi:hypothetical protein
MEKLDPMKSINFVLVSIILIGLLLAGCSQETPGGDQTESVPTATIETSPIVPTETTTSPMIVLLAGSEVDPADMAETEAVLQQAANQYGMTYEHRQMLTPDSAPPNLQLVVALPPVNGLEQLASALPETRVVALGVPGVNSTANLIAVTVEGNPDFQAFMAGYIAAVQADDWRLGLVYVGDESGRQYRNAFLNGAIFYCGLCTPYFPPYNGYPVYAEVAPGASVEAYQQAVDSLIFLGVNTMHLAPGAQSEELYRYAAAQNIRFVGTEAPPAGLEQFWIASVVSAGEMDLGAVISQALAGSVRIEIEGSIEITFTGLSEARISFFYEMLEQLQNGAVDPQGGDIE